MKENEEQRRQRDVQQVKTELEMENMAKLNNLRQELHTTHNDQVNRMRQDHQREIQRLMTISGVWSKYKISLQFQNIAKHTRDKNEENH